VLINSQLWHEEAILNSYFTVSMANSYDHFHQFL